MEIRQLRSAAEVARRLSFTRAAEALNIAQPALSQQIAALEREIGVRLFERNNRKVALTDAGRAFLARADGILADVSALGEEMSAYGGGLRGRVLVGTYQSFAEYALPKMLGRFHAEYPRIEVALREGMADDLLASLQSGQLDIFVGHISETPFAQSPHFREEPLYEDELVIAVAGSHRLASRSTVRIEELRDEPFVIFRPGSQMTRRLFSLAGEVGFTPRVVFESLDTMTIRSLVAEGLGVALFPRTLGNMPGPRVSLLSFAPQRVMRRMSLVTRNATLAPSVELFTRFLRDAMDEA